MKKNATYSGTREIRTFVDLAHGANVLIQKSDADQHGSYYTVMGSLLMSAFTFEAYLNHLGDKSFSFWAEIESAKVLDKYTILCKHLSVVPDFSRLPYQTLRSLFKFRNAIAHGKSVVLTETKQINLESNPHDHSPKAHWEEYCTVENAKRAKLDVSAIIKELHIAAGLGEHPFINGIGISSVTDK